MYDNGAVPRLEYTESNVEDWMVNLSKSRPYSGIVLNNVEDVSLWDNKVNARYDDDFAYKIQFNRSPPPLASCGNNMAIAMYHSATKVIRSWVSG